MFSFTNLHKIEVTEDSAGEIAQQIAEITSQSDELTAEGAEIVAAILEDIVLIGNTSLDVSD